MPRFKKHHLDKFKEVYKSHFGEDITDTEAAEMAARVLNLICLIQGIDKEFFPSDFPIEDDQSWRDELPKKAA